MVVFWLDCNHSSHLYEAAELDGPMPGSSFGILPTWITTLVFASRPFYVAEFEQVYVITGGGY